MFIFHFILFLLNPLLGIVSSAVDSILEQINSKKTLYGLAFLLSAYLGLLNTTKELLGDMIKYHQYFITVPSYSSLIQFINHFGKEPLFYSFTYISHYLLFGNWSAYIWLITLINYMCLSYSIIEVGKKYEVENYIIVFVLFFMAFFFQEFSISSHMIRQCTAQSISLAFFVSYFFLEKKTSWWIALLALGIHTSVLPIIALSYIPQLKHVLTFKKFAVLLIWLCILVTMYVFFAKILSNLPFIGYVVGRTSNMKVLFGTDFWQKEVGMNSIMRLLLFADLGMSFAVHRRLFYVQDYRPKESLFINLFYCLALFLFVCLAINANYLIMRYFFFIYTFQNIILLLFAHYYIKNNEIFYLSFVIVLLVYFFYMLENGVFSYVSVIEALFCPVPLYFI